MSESHAHTWNEIARVVEGESRDTYSTCPCGRVLHVYDYAPGNVRHETEHTATSWTSGYAHGLARAGSLPTGGSMFVKTSCGGGAAAALGDGWLVIAVGDGRGVGGASGYTQQIAGTTVVAGTWPDPRSKP